MKKKKKTKTNFKRGTVVVFEPNNFNPEYWKGLSEEDKIKYYGPLGYGAEKPKLFVFLSKINDEHGNDTGHCVLVSLDDQRIETMRHTNDFRKATDEEF